MKFAKQRFIITVLFLFLPLCFLFALIQSPFVSDLSLSWALKIARFRTGLKVTAENWNVNIPTFSVSLENFQFQADTWVLSAPVVQLRVSPIGLLIGKLNISSLDIQNPSVLGNIPKEFQTAIDSFVQPSSKTQLTDPKKSIGESTKDEIFGIPSKLGKEIFQFSELLYQRNLRFESLRLKNLKVLLGDFNLRSGDVEIENYGDGQSRLQVSLSGLRLSPIFSSLETVEFSIALLRGSRTEYFFLVPKFLVDTQNASLPLKIEANGRFPGLMVFRYQGNLEGVSELFSPNPGLLEKIPQNPRGLLQVDSEINTSKSGFISARAKISARGLAFGRFNPNDLDLEFESTEGQTKVSKMQLTLPRDVGDGDSWKNYFETRDLEIFHNADSPLSVKGLLQFDQTGLCAILKSVGDELCPVALRISGSIPIEGPLNPLQLRASPDLEVSETLIEGEDIKDFENQSNPILKVGNARLQGSTVVDENKIDLNQIKIVWSEKTLLDVTGSIGFSPLVLKLKATGPSVDMSEMLNEFLGLTTQGTGTLEADITYDESLPKFPGWTWINGKLSLENVGVEGQNFGSLSGPVNFRNLALEIGPLKLSRGGGRADIQGKLTGFDTGTQLKLGGRLDRLEVLTTVPGLTREIYEGFVSGTFNFFGSLDKKKADFFGGPINLKLNNFSLFGIPFLKGSLNSRYNQGILYFENIEAESIGSRVSGSGLLHPESGSRIEFESPGFKISSLNLGMGLNELKSGNLRAKGFWSRADGWGIDGQSTDLVLGGKRFPNAKVNVKGTDNLFSVEYKNPGLVEFAYQSESNKGPTLLQIQASNEGIYGAFAFLKSWEIEKNVKTLGRLLVNWNPNSGFVRTQNFFISGPVGREGIQSPLINIPGDHEFVWKEGSVVSSNFNPSPESSIWIKPSPGSRSVEFGVKTNLALLDLFVPNFQFFDGNLDLKGILPLNPDISTLSAQGNISNGSLQIRGLGLPVNQVSSRLSIASQILNFSEGRGQMGSGEVQFSGGYRLSLEKPGASIKTTLNKAQVIVLDDIPADVSGEINVSGENLPYLISGNVVITNALYTKEFTSTESNSSATDRSFLNFAIDAELGNQTRVKNSLADVVTTGRMSLRGTEVIPEIRGRVLLGNGTFSANQNVFQIIQGSVDFPGGRPGTPLVNVQGTTRVKANNQDYRVELRVRGPGTNPVLDFSSDPALPTQDIVSLLAFGLVRSDQGGLDANADLAGAARVEAFQALFGKTLGKGLDKTTGFQVQFRAAPDQAQKEFIPKVMVSRKLTDKVTASFGNSLDFAKPERNLQVDYNLLKNVNITGVWEQGVEEQDSSVGVDLRFKFDVK